MGEPLVFNLSLALFSSFDIDLGTKLLLKTIANQKLISGHEAILDAGCGVGTIAISLKKKFPKAIVTAIDRDALAVKFTKENAALNKLSNGIKTASGLLPGGGSTLDEESKHRYDLIVSNIPAKAGAPVIKDFLQNCGLHLNKGGKVAVVIVHQLSDFAKSCLIESNAKIVFEESDKNYSVFHFTPGQKTQKTFFEIYNRSSGDITGFYGLPEFDTISYCTITALEAMKTINWGAKTLIWNPGIGYTAVKCKESEELILASYDLLQLKASQFNIKSSCRLLHLPFLADIKDSTEDFDTIIASPRFVPGAKAEYEIVSSTLDLLKQGGTLMVSGKSSDIAKIEKIKKGFIVKNSIKYRGFRSMVLQKNII